MQLDRRVRYTKMVLKQSLLELMQSAPISKITVTDVCKRAEVNRGTFYAHFEDVYNLLEQIENDLMEDVVASFPPTFAPSDLKSVLTLIFETIQANSALCKVLFSEYGDKDFLSRILYVARDSAINQWLSVCPTAPIEELEQLYTFYANGAVAIISDWVKNDLKQSPAELARFIEQVSLHGLDAIIHN